MNKYITELLGITCIKLNAKFYLRFIFTDRLHISLYKNAQDCFKDGQAKTTLPLEDFFGIESGFALDRESHVMAIVCTNSVLLLAFHNRETLIQWEIRIRSHLGEGKSFIWVGSFL